MNPAQLEAATSRAPHILVRAAPGSGKTRTLVERIALLLEGDTHPSEILALTFTRKAAGEMKERLETRLLPGRGLRFWLRFWHSLTVTTFHGWACSILRQYADRVGLPRNFSIRDEKDKENLIFYAARELGLCPEPGATKRKGQWTSAERLWREESVRTRYYGLLREAKAVDFDGLETLLLRLLRQEDIAAELRLRYRHVLVDEGQDTSADQQEILDTLAPRNLFVVGDYAQSIYSFRGAHVDGFVGLGAREGWVTIDLATNYRSLGPIVDAATRLGRAMATPGLEQVAGRAGGTEHTIRAVPVDGLVSDVALHAEECGPESMAILSPRWDLLEELAAELTTAGIPHVVARRTLQVWDTQPAKWLINCLRAALNPEDHVALYEALTAFTPRVYPGAWAKLRAGAMRQGAPVLGWYHMQDEAPVLVDRLWVLHEALLDEPDGWPEEADALLTHLCAELQRLHLDAKLTELGQVELAVCAWGDARRTEGEPMRVQDLLDWYAGRRVTEAEAEAAPDAVTLTTIHGAKGLEWPYVWILGCDEGIFPRSGEIEEQRRLMYVAITRGMERVRMCHAGIPSRFIAEALGSAVTPTVEDSSDDLPF